MAEVTTGSLVTSDGVRIAFDVYGSGPAAVLSHGFAADANLNWVQPKVVEALVASGRQVITLDSRGHGRSGKPHEPAAYSGLVMVHDVQAVLDHLQVTSVDAVGYSMGGLVTASLMVADPRVRSAVLGGVGRRLVMSTAGGSEPDEPAVAADGAGPAPQQPGSTGARLAFDVIADALLAEDPGTIDDEQARGFRAFADLTGADRQALAALQRARRPQGVDVASVTIPVLVIAGDRDELVGDPAQLTAAIPGAEVAVVHGDHLQAVFDPAFAGGIVRFLDRVSPVRPAGS